MKQYDINKDDRFVILLETRKNYYYVIDRKFNTEWEVDGIYLVSDEKTRKIFQTTNDAMLAIQIITELNMELLKCTC